MSTGKKELIGLVVVFIATFLTYFWAFGNHLGWVVVLTFLTVFCIWATYLKELDTQHNILKINRGDIWPKKPKK